MESTQRGPPVAAEDTASRYQNDKLMQYQIGKKGP
jgi:hypothetical protein